MSKFRKKPVVIEAIQLTEEIALACMVDKQPGPFGLTVCGDCHPPTRKVGKAYVVIRTLEGDMTASLGDWIIKGVKGEFYPCKDQIFKMTYEPADEATS